MSNLAKMAIVLVSLSFGALAAPVANIPIDVTQPESEVPGGKSFKVHPKGDEWGSWYETDDGYTVIKDDATGAWHYGQLDAAQKLRPSGKLVGRDQPQAFGLKRHVRPSPSAKSPHSTAPLPNVLAATAMQQAVTAPVIGNVPTLFILVQFTDRAGTYGAANFASLLSNQLQTYFREVSYGRFGTAPAAESHGTANDGVVGWLPLNQPHPNTAGSTDVRNQQLAKDAMLAADPYVNYAAFDLNNDNYVDSNELAVVVIPAGYETAYDGGLSSPSVWGHQWSIWAVAAPVVDGKLVGDFHNSAGGYAQFGEIHQNHVATIGIMAHELGHLILRLPDLYDTSFISEGIGNFSLMAGGSWAQKPTDPYAGQSPVHPDAWCKLYNGWVDPVVNGVGPVTFPAVGSAAATAANAVQMQTTTDPAQYFLFENRGQYGYDAGLSGLMSGMTGVSGTPGGLAVWHVDESMRTATTWWAPNDIVTHKFLDLEEADNVSTMDTVVDRGQANDFFFSPNKGVFDDLSSPNSKLYSAASTGIALNSLSAPSQSMTGNFGLISQTITFGPAPSLIIGGTATVSATASSRLPVTFSSLTTAVCTIAGTTVTGVTAGTCTIAANQAGDGTYAPAPQTTQNIDVGKIPQTITFGAAPLVSVGGTGAVSATASSGLVVIYSSLTPTVCAIAGNTVTGSAIGDCTIAADQLGDATYAPAPRLLQTFAIGKASQSITFGAAPTISVNGTGAVSATASSRLSVSYGTATPGVCSIAGSTVTGVTAGNCTITADQTGNGTYAPAPQATQTFAIAKANQTISFGLAPTVTVGGSGVVSAVATSGLSVTFSSTTPSVCTLAGNTVTGVAAGNCVIAADQGGDANYNPAPQVVQSIQVVSAVWQLSVTRVGSGSVISTPAGIDCGATCSANFTGGTVVTMTATPATGSVFAGWSGACTGTGTCNVTMSSATGVTATFNTASYALTVSKAGTGVGTVVSAPIGVNCGGVCSATFTAGTVVTLTATPAAGSVFAGWSGTCAGTGACTVTMDTAKTITATFDASGTATTYPLSVTKRGSGSGLVSSSPAGINCGSVCTSSFAANTVVTLTAAPTPGSKLAEWKGACAGAKSATCKVTMSAAKSVTVKFDRR